MAQLHTSVLLELKSSILERIRTYITKYLPLLGFVAAYVDLIKK